MTLSDLAILFIPVLIVALLWHQNRVRMIALRHARIHTQKNHMQLLDQTVSLTGLTLTRDHQKLPAIKRIYGFEFSVRGDRRYRGKITMVAHRVVRVESEAVPETEFF